jgi:hypothetical protein
LHSFAAKISQTVEATVKNSGASLAHAWNCSRFFASASEQCWIADAHREDSLTSGSLNSVLPSPVSFAGRHRVLSSAFALSVSHRIVFSSLMERFTAALVTSRVTPQSAAQISKPKVYRSVLVVFFSFLTIVVAGS